MVRTKRKSSTCRRRVKGRLKGFGVARHREENPGWTLTNHRLSDSSPNNYSQRKLFGEGSIPSGCFGEPMANPQPVISETKHLKSIEFRGPIEIVHRVVETEVICSESVTITVRKQSLQEGPLTDEEEASVYRHLESQAEAIAHDICQMRMV